MAGSISQKGFSGALRPVNRSAFGIVKRIPVNTLMIPVIKINFS
jgi:hypothetical protein